MAITLILLLVVGAFAIAGILGAPYVPILRRDSGPLLDLLDLAPGQTLIDLGSGDGQLLRAAAARGIRCVGYEINPVMVMVSRLVCWRYRHLVTIHTANLWNVKLPPADVIYIFIMPRHIERLRQMLEHEIIKPTRVVSYIFEIPGLKTISRGANSYVYQFGQPEITS